MECVRSAQTHHIATAALTAAQTVPAFHALPMERSADWTTNAVSEACVPYHLRNKHQIDPPLVSEGGVTVASVVEWAVEWGLATLADLAPVFKQKLAHLSHL